MLVIHRDSGRIEHRMFSDFESYLKPDDLLILNNTRVIPARVFSDDGKIELLCLDQLSQTVWRCLTKPGKRMKLGFLASSRCGERHSGVWCSSRLGCRFRDPSSI